MSEIDSLLGTSSEEQAVSALHIAIPETIQEIIAEQVAEEIAEAEAQVEPHGLATIVGEEGIVKSLTVLDMLMARIGDVDQQSPFMNLFIYGPPGVGKSVFLGTADNNLIIDVEDGAKSIRNHPELINKPGKAQTLEYRSVRQVEELIKYMGEDAEPLRKYEVLSIDSYSSLCVRALTQQVKDMYAQDSSRNPYLPIGPDYNINTQHMNQLANSAHDLQRHVIFTCHSKEIKDDSTGKILIRPDLTPKIAGEIDRIFDLVGYFTADVANDGTVSNRRLQVHPTDKILAKSRIGGLPTVIENPTFGMLLEAYQKSSIKKVN